MTCMIYDCWDGPCVVDITDFNNEIYSQVALVYNLLNNIDVILCSY